VPFGYGCGNLCFLIGLKNTHLRLMPGTNELFQENKSMLTKQVMHTTMRILFES
jgi:hypothetical protein